METVYRIEPTRLDEVSGTIANIIAELSAASAQLGSALHIRTAASLAEMVRVMNTYYSNLIEGHRTRPKDIEDALAALRNRPRAGPSTVRIDKALLEGISAEDSSRDLLVEAVAHVRVQAQIDKIFAEPFPPEPASEDYVKFLHREFYRDAPESMLRISNVRGANVLVVAGEWRTDDVAVGIHQPPSSDRVEDFMHRFAECYRLAPLGKAERILAIPAAHHRFNYIHPFTDGNGRVSRLMSHAMAHKAGIGANGLWSVSRGLARGLESRHDYMRMMAHADMPRQGDMDGRGNLSLKALADFTEWFLRVCLDQVRFMTGLFELNNLSSRLRKCIDASPTLRPEGTRLLEEALVRGSFERGSAARITGLPVRSARRVLVELLAVGLLASDSPKGPVHLRFPMAFQDILFPRLFGET